MQIRPHSSQKTPNRTDLSSRIRHAVVVKAAGVCVSAKRFRVRACPCNDRFTRGRCSEAFPGCLSVLLFGFRLVLPGIPLRHGAASSTRRRPGPSFAPARPVNVPTKAQQASPVRDVRGRCKLISCLCRNFSSGIATSNAANGIEATGIASQVEAPTRRASGSATVRRLNLLTPRICEST